MSDESPEGFSWEPGELGWSSLEPPPGTQAPEPPSVAQQPGSTKGRPHTGIIVASVPAVIGWLMLGFVVLLVGLSADVACTAHRGDAYQGCVRGDDLASLRAQAAIMGLSLASFVPILCQLSRHVSTSRLNTLTKTAVIVSGSLVAVSVVGWIFGATGLWAPDRPFPYEPVSVARGSTIMLQGAVVGLVIGFVICATIAPRGRERNQSKR